MFSEKIFCAKKYANFIEISIEKCYLSNAINIYFAPVVVIINTVLSFSLLHSYLIASVHQCVAVGGDRG